MCVLDTVNLAMASLQAPGKWVLEKLKKNLLESIKEREKKENETALATSPIFKNTTHCMIALPFGVLLSFKMRLRLMMMSTAQGSLQSQN